MVKIGTIETRWSTVPMWGGGVAVPRKHMQYRRTGLSSVLATVQNLSPRTTPDLSASSQEDAL